MSIAYKTKDGKLEKTEVQVLEKLVKDFDIVKESKKPKK
jgi:hypothetical protein